MTKVGIQVICAVCGNMKKPIGRSGPLGLSYCEAKWDAHGCEGYRQKPYPGSLWPGETEEEFGYPVGVDGWVEAPR